MRRSKGIYNIPKSILINFYIFKKIFEIFFRKFTVILFQQGNTFLTCNFTVSYFLRCIICCSSDPKFNVSRVVMKIINLVINTVVLTVLFLFSIITQTSHVRRKAFYIVCSSVNYLQSESGVDSIRIVHAIFQ